MLPPKSKSVHCYLSIGLFAAILCFFLHYRASNLRFPERKKNKKEQKQTGREGILLC